MKNHNLSKVCLWAFLFILLISSVNSATDYYNHAGNFDIDNNYRSGNPDLEISATGTYIWGEETVSCTDESEFRGLGEVGLAIFSLYDFDNDGVNEFFLKCDTKLRLYEVTNDNSILQDQDNIPLLHSSLLALTSDNSYSGDTGVVFIGSNGTANDWNFYHYSYNGTDLTMECEVPINYSKVTAGSETDTYTSIACDEFSSVTRCFFMEQDQGLVKINLPSCEAEYYMADDNTTNADFQCIQRSIITNEFPDNGDSDYKFISMCGVEGGTDNFYIWNITDGSSIGGLYTDWSGDGIHPTNATISGSEFYNEYENSFFFTSYGGFLYMIEYNHDEPDYIHYYQDTGFFTSELFTEATFGWSSHPFIDDTNDDGVVDICRFAEEADDDFVVYCQASDTGGIVRWGVVRNDVNKSSIFPVKVNGETQIIIYPHMYDLDSGIFYEDVFPMNQTPGLLFTNLTNIEYPFGVVDWNSDGLLDFVQYMGDESAPYTGTDALVIMFQNVTTNATPEVTISPFVENPLCHDLASINFTISVTDDDLHGFSATMSCYDGATTVTTVSGDSTPTSFVSNCDYTNTSQVGVEYYNFSVNLTDVTGQNDYEYYEVIVTDSIICFESDAGVVPTFGAGATPTDAGYFDDLLSAFGIDTQAEQVFAVLLIIISIMVTGMLAGIKTGHMGLPLIGAGGCSLLLLIYATYLSILHPIYIIIIMLFLVVGGVAFFRRGFTGGD